MRPTRTRLRIDYYGTMTAVPVRHFPGVQDVALHQGLAEVLRRPCRYCGVVGEHIPDCRFAWPAPAPRKSTNVPAKRRRRRG